MMLLRFIRFGVLQAVVEREAPRLPETVGFSPDVLHYVAIW